LRRAIPILALGLSALGAEAPVPARATAWLDRPVSLADCLNLALQQNAAVLKSKQDLQAAHGVVVQTRAIVLPKVRVAGDYAISDEGAVEKLSFALPPGLGAGNLPGIQPGNQRWSGTIRLVQSVYEGGRLKSAWQTARLTREQAVAQHQAVLADTALEVRVAYADVLLAAQQIVVSEASLDLLGKELEDTNRRHVAGTVPRFNVLRAEVEQANARPRLIRAKNAYRIAKNNLAHVLGFHVPKEVFEDIPLQLTGTLESEKLEIALPAALLQALEKRPELIVLRKAEQLRKEAIVTARAGYLPSLEAFGGYGSHNSTFFNDLARDVSGWQAGVQLSWDVFDGGLSRGKVSQARALYEKAQVETDDATRRIELEVRTAYSNLLEAWEVLESQKKVQEQAQEALRLAGARAEAGSGTQLDVLSAQTALTEARTTQIQAQRDYTVARDRLERAIGAYVPAPQPAQ
jgi:outer membrane protein TolC